MRRGRRGSPRTASCSPALPACTAASTVETPAYAPGTWRFANARDHVSCRVACRVVCRVVPAYPEKNRREAMARFLRILVALRACRPSSISSTCTSRTTKTSQHTPLRNRARAARCVRRVRRVVCSKGLYREVAAAGRDWGNGAGAGAGWLGRRARSAKSRPVRRPHEPSSSARRRKLLPPLAKAAPRKTISRVRRPITGVRVCVCACAVVRACTCACAG